MEPRKIIARPGESEPSPNLVFFYQDRWRDIVKVCKIQKFETSRDKSFQYFSLLESFLWLFEGARIGYFAMEHSRSLAISAQEVLLNAYAEARGNEHFGSIKRHLQIDLERELRNPQKIFANVELSRDVPLGQACGFQNALLVSNSFARDECASSLMQDILFMNLQEWDLFLKNLNESFNRVNNMHYADQDKKICDWVVHGVFEVFDHIKAYELVDRDLATIAGISSSTLASWRERLRSIQKWRLSFGNQRVMDRFLRTLDLVINHWTQTALDGKTRVENRQEVSQLAKDIWNGIRIDMIVWGAPPLAQATVHY